MYYLINRYYDPVIGRFISKDPASDPEDFDLDPAEANPYVYAANNPVMVTDPDGLNPMLKPGDSDATYVPLVKGMLINIANHISSEPNYAAYITNPSSAGFGPGLEKAVNAFKTARGLVANGQVGSTVWDKVYIWNDKANAAAQSSGGQASGQATGGGTAEDAAKVLDDMASRAVWASLSLVKTEQIAFPHSGNATKYLRTVLQVNANYAYLNRPSGLAGFVGEAAKYVWFYEMVKKWGPWDLKRAAYYHERGIPFLQFRRKIISPDDFGNIHFGYVGRALEIPLEILLEGSGFANKYLGGGKSDEKEAFDQGWVRYGYKLYKKRWGGTKFTWPWQTNVYIRT